jgi:hypothetical protein
MRINKGTLDNLCAVLNRRLNRPATAWTRLDKPAKDGHTMQANVGHIKVSRWSPGDGWTRCQVVEMMEHGGENTISPTGTTAETFYYLRGVLDSLDCRYTAGESEVKNG